MILKTILSPMKYFLILLFLSPLTVVRADTHTSSDLCAEIHEIMAEAVKGRVINQQEADQLLERCQLAAG